MQPVAQLTNGDCAFDHARVERRIVVAQPLDRIGAGNLAGDARDQHVEVERLANHVVGAGPKRVDCGDCFALPPDHDQRQIVVHGILADHPRQFDPAGALHRQLADQRVRRHPMHFGEGRLGAVGGRDAIAGLRNAACEQPQIIAVGLGDQHPRLRALFGIGVENRLVHCPGR